MATKPSSKPFMKCSMPNCNERVSWHNKGKAKQFCEQHRTDRKAEVDAYKLSKGCVNVDGRYGGVKCTATITKAYQLDINHINGHNWDRRPENQEVICKFCHPIATEQGGHHKTSGNLKPNIDDSAFNNNFSVETPAP